MGKFDIPSFVDGKIFELDISETKQDEIIKHVNRYDAPHRFYHNLSHIGKMISDAMDRKMLTDDLFLAIVFHDIIYDPKRDDNEKLSAELFNKYFPENDTVFNAILETKTHNPSSDLSKQLCDLDLSILYSNYYEDFIDYENKIFKEYQFVDYNVYKEKQKYYPTSESILNGSITSNIVNLTSVFMRVVSIRSIKAITTY